MFNQSAFGQAASNQPVGLIPFLMAGHPSLDTTEELVSVLISEGAQAIELGVPFSDALADGPVIQLAAQRALQHNVSLDDVLELTRRIQARHPGFPIIIFSYLNPLLQLGLEAYVNKAKQVGVYATLAVDLPPEEAAEYCAIHEAHGLKTIFLASPTTSRERLPLIDRLATGFIYVVSRTGVTGVQSQVSQTLGEEVKRLRGSTNRPLAIGFGISTGDQACEVARIADAVVVGSAFVKLIEERSRTAENNESSNTSIGSLIDDVRLFARELINQIRLAR